MVGGRLLPAHRGRRLAGRGDRDPLVFYIGTSVETSLAARLVVGALLGLAAWQLLSGRWAIDLDATVLEAERTLVYAGAAASAFLIVSRDRAQALVLGVLAGTGIVTVGGLLEHVLRTGASDDRLELPVGYANASGSSPR